MFLGSGMSIITIKGCGTSQQESYIKLVSKSENFTDIFGGTVVYGIHFLPVYRV